MAQLISEAEIEKIKSLLGLPHLEVVLRPTWGSKNSNYRDEIHGDLKKKMAKAYPFSDSSISHCKSMGGFAFTIYDSNHVIGLGFDLEEDSRVTAEIARRVCRNEGEFLNAPSAASLWAAKEAAFKSLKGLKQPLVISEIEMAGWQKLDSQFETTFVKDPQAFGSSRIQGVLVKKTPYTFSFFIASP